MPSVIVLLLCQWSTEVPMLFYLDQREMKNLFFIYIIISSVRQSNDIQMIIEHRIFWVCFFFLVWKRKKKKQNRTEQRHPISIVPPDGRQQTMLHLNILDYYFYCIHFNT